MTLLYCDCETRSRVNLKSSNVYRYSEDPSFKILMVAWALDDGPIEVETTQAGILDIPGLWDADVLKVAHNAAFERVVFSRFGGAPTGRYMRSQEWLDTAVLAAEAGYPRSLEGAAKALGAEEKDSAGTRLISLFCVPKRDGTFTQPEEKPEEWARFVEYCRQDVSTLRDIHRRLPDWPTPTEEQVYHADQAINDRGMPIDLDLARAAHSAAEDNRVQLETEVAIRTGIKNPGSRDQVLAYLKSIGLRMPDMTADTVEAMLARTDLTPDQRYVLEARQELALSASSKYAAALANVCSDGRVRGAYQFHGAHTGRWSGRGIQPQNLPRASLKDETAVETAILDLRMGNGADPYTLKALVRPMFLGPMTVADYSSIEARVVAWLAGEQWALDAAMGGRDLYVETANRMGPRYTRREGKVAVLALGYNGGINSLRHMGAEGTDEELQGIVTQWREANPKIVRYWKTLEDVFWSGGRARRIRVEKDGSDRRVILPSGRAITYHRVKAQMVEKFGRPTRQISFADPGKGWARMGTYGGRLTENVTQAVARDILADAIVKLEANGYPVLGHIHDEVLVEGEDIEGVDRIMTDAPAWAKGLPVATGDTFTAARYRK